MKYNNTMIVDDEVLALDHLANLIDWQSNGYYLVARATSANEAVSLFQEKKPTIIIADISMPMMNGIEMMSHILTFNIPVRFIFLTAYREFNYIQEAMQLGASGFILKNNLSAELLLHELDKAARQLRVEIYGQLVADAQEIEVSKSGPVIMVGLEPDFVYPCTGAVPVKTYLPPTEQIRRIDYSRYKFIDYAKVADFHQNRCWLEIQVKCIYSQLAFMDELRSFLNEVRSIFRYILDTTISIAAHTVPTDRQYLPDKRVSLNQLLDARFFLGKEQLLFADNPPQIMPGTRVSAEEINALGQALNWGENIRETLGGLFDRVYGSMEYFDFLVRGLGMEIDHVRQQLEEPSLHDLYRRGMLDTSLWYDFAGIQKWFEQEFSMLSEKLRQYNEPSSKSAWAIRLIDKCYNREDISLDWAAQQMGISSVYLLKLLKKETGKTFTELLTERRMEAATQLLLNGRIKNRDLAEQVGYRSAQYFITVFKKYYNCTPQEYKHR